MLAIALDISKGMEHIHSHKIIHGDLSSNNILLKSLVRSLNLEYICKVTDFGTLLKPFIIQNFLVSVTEILIADKQKKRMFLCMDR